MTLSTHATFASDGTEERPTASDLNTIIDAVNAITDDDPTFAGDLTVEGALIAEGTLDVTGAVTTTAGIADDGGALIVGYLPTAVQQALSDAGAASLTAYYTAWTTTEAAAGTLAAGSAPGQLKKVQVIVYVDDLTLTFNTDATIVFGAAGDFALLLWDGAAWVPIELGNDADGATAPVYTPAS